MNSWKWIAVGIGLSSVLPAAWMIWNPTYTAGVILTIWSAAASFGSAWYVRRTEAQREVQRRRAYQRSLEKIAIKTLNHHRHDWMNELQILYGYIQLGKLDKSVQCVGRIKERMLQDSKISKLGLPSLVFYLHSYRTFNTGLQLDVEVADDVQLEGKLSEETEEHFTESIIEVVRIYQLGGRSSWEEERLLTLTFVVQEKELVAEFTGEGYFGDQDSITHKIELAVHESIRVEKIHTDHMTYRLCLPYVT
ncbi:Spo0B domain-containing protein [Paenibacillus faecalis]|uniref:Spo0B domain-containing protein n=1 Tax=Paenibacillus faecalis TaxID=2079532 RepID=UPI000D0F9FC5|nr:Spo0B domain-containing protein [Paenibacillus faecalis]